MFRIGEFSKIAQVLLVLLRPSGVRKIKPGNDVHYLINAMSMCGLMGFTSRFVTEKRNTF